MSQTAIRASLQEEFRRWRDRDQPIKVVKGTPTSKQPFLINGMDLIRAFNSFLPMLEQEAKFEGRRRQSLERCRAKYPHLDNEELLKAQWALDRKHLQMREARQRKAEQQRLARQAAYREQRREAAQKQEERERKAAQQKNKVCWDRLFQGRMPTQAELQERAKEQHWSEIVYEAGTDRILRIEP